MSSQRPTRVMVEQWVTAAGHLADRAVEDHAAALASATTPEAADRARLRLRAERERVASQLAEVLQDQWWASADAVTIAGAWAAARTWTAHNDPLARRAAERIRDELQQRFDLVVDLPRRSDQ